MTVEVKTPNAVILIADDDKGNDNMYIKKVVATLGYENAQTMTDSMEAVDLVKSGVGAILILNLNNKTLNGYDATKMLKKNPVTSHVPVFITSHDRAAKDILAARSAGVDGYIIKPITTKSILGQIDQAAKSRIEKIVQLRKTKEKELVNRQDSMDKERANKRELYDILIKLLGHEVAAFPWYYRTYLELGKTLLLAGEGGKAIPYLNKAIGLSPKTPATFGLLAKYYSEKGDLEQAITCLEKGLSITYNHKAQIKLGELQFKIGDYPHAINTFTKIIKSIENIGAKESNENRVKLANGFNQRGKVYHEKGVVENDDSLLQRAGADFEKSIEFNPGLIAAQYNLMVTYKKRGNTEKALAILEKIGSIEPDDFEGWLQVAKVYYLDEDISKASFALNKAWDFAKNNIDSRKNVCDLLVDFSMIDKAESRLLETQKDVPDDIYFPNKLGIVYRRQGRPELAVGQYETALKHDSENVSVWFNLGRALLDTGKTEKAREILEKCLVLDPEFEEAKALLEDKTEN